MPEHRTGNATGGPRTGALSEPIEDLIQDQACGPIFIKKDNKDPNSKVWPVHVLVIGSGYGGSIAAMRLASDECNVVVFERGKEYASGEFPETLQEMPGHVQFMRKDKDLPVGNADALFDFRLGNPVSVLVGNGLGGGSLINANVAMEPEDDLFKNSRWPKTLTRDKLQPSFEAVKNLLGVTTYKDAKKYEALERLADTMGVVCRPAPITVTTKDGQNAVGIPQKACIGCGNCVTGCNFEAKNTLPMNALPLAECRGARLYTGATVLSVEPAGALDGSDGWSVRFRRTDTSKTTLQTEVFTLHAQVVVLAAGTLGSTEILLRSKKNKDSGETKDRWWRGTMEFSELLGGRFSTNGDAIAFGYAQENKVNAVATVAQPPDRRNIGPTITGYVKADVGLDRPITIEDGAVPSSLAHVFGEVLATASVFKRNIKARLPAWFRNPANRDQDGKHKDPLSVHPRSLDNSQVLLVMGDDGATDTLELKPRDDDAPDDPDRFRIRIRKPAGDTLPKPKKEPPVFDAVDRLLRHAERVGAFDGGDYLPNPFWKVLPDALSTSLPAPGKQLLSVHPIGGCPMGEDVAFGVVNDEGQVFRADGKLYRGLYVMDGAIMPCALGVNPFLTISALAYRNAEQLGKAQGWPVRGLRAQGEDPKAQQQQKKAALQVGQAQDAFGKLVNGEFVEVMTGELRPDKEVPRCVIDSLGKQAAELRKEDRLALKVQIQIEGVLQWLQKPDKPLGATATLYWNDGSINPVQDERLVPLSVNANNGAVKLLAWDRPKGWLEQANRALYAICAFLDRRGLGDVSGGVAWWNPAEVIKIAVGFLRVAWNHANWRQLNYHFTFQTATGQIEMDGTKELAYAQGKKDPWSALTELPFKLRCNNEEVDGLLRVDLVSLTKRAPFQAKGSSDSPSAIMAMISAGMMFSRVMFQTHFWSFGAPNYPEQKIKADRQPQPILVPKPKSRWDQYLENLQDIVTLVPKITEEKPAQIPPSFIDLPVPKSRVEWSNKINLRLVHYEPKNPSRGSILLIHGLASGSRVFTTPTIDENFATYLYRLGYDVWLFDYRVSIALPDRIAEGQWDMDQIGRYDMAAAVGHVYMETGQQPIQVFAHCVGAASLAMGILGGHCQDGQKNQSMISALALHAVQPWPVPSPVNHLKANLAAFVRDGLTWKTLDAVLPPLPPKPGETLSDGGSNNVVTSRDIMMDRIAGSIPFPPSLKEDLDRHLSETDRKSMGKNICDRMTLFYGWEWNHGRQYGGLNEETHKQLADLVGVANFETFRHIYFLLTRKRLTTRMGEDTYVKADNFAKFWTFPTLFAHGRDNQLYDPRSAIASCRRLRDLRRQAGHPKGPANAYDVHWFEANPCGHFDFLFGKNANKIVYPSVSAFFQQKRNDTLPPTKQVKLTADEGTAWAEIANKPLDTDRDPYWEYSPIPYRGPIIGWARPHETKQDTIAIRIWVEPYRFSARQAHIGDFIAPPGITIERRPLPEVGGYPVRDYPGAYWVYDLEIPKNFGKDLYMSIENIEQDPWILFRVDEVAQISYGEFKKNLAEGLVKEVSVSKEVIRGRLRADRPLGHVFWTLSEDDPDLSKELKKQHVLETDMTGYISLTRSDWFKKLETMPTSKGMAFLVGSCRYPGSPFDEVLADQVFDAMTRQVTRSQAGPGVDHVMLVGDQIYADATADVFDTQELRERFASQYRQAFGARHLRRLLGSVPTYMALDDHEFGDNWTGDENAVSLDDPFVRKFGANFQHGLAAAMAYQWSMGPRDGWKWPPDPPFVDNQGLWYTFTSGGLPFFVMDTRTERSTRRAGKHENESNIVGNRQFTALKNWLLEQHKDKENNPKFIVSGSVLAPVSKKLAARKWLYRSNDGWAGFPATWRELVQHIVEHQIQKVVFVAGDYHLSAYAHLTLSSPSGGKPDVVAHQIVSSGLFVPLSFANPRKDNYEWDTASELPFSDKDATIKVVPTCLCLKSSHFLRVDVCESGSRWSIKVSAWDCTGDTPPEKPFAVHVWTL